MEADVKKIEQEAAVCDVPPETYAFWLGFFQGDYERTTVELITR